MCDATLSLDDAAEIWSLVERQLDAFCHAWDQSPPQPELADFVEHDNLALRKLVLTELIKVDLEQRCGDPALVRSIDIYLDQWPELVSDGVVPAELLYEEIYQRRLQGEEVDANEYLQRYPQSADALRRLVGIDAAEVSTALSHSRLDREYSVGDVIDDFDLRVELGRGAFAVVFLAVQRSMQRMVALKISANGD